MGYELRRWLAERLPPQVSSGERLVALEAADQANELTRRAFGKVMLQTVIRRTGFADEKQLGKVLGKLAANGVELRVPVRDKQGQVVTDKRGRVLFACNGHALEFYIPTAEECPALRVAGSGDLEATPAGGPSPDEAAPAGGSSTYEAPPLGAASSQEGPPPGPEAPPPGPEGPPSGGPISSTSPHVSSSPDPSMAQQSQRRYEEEEEAKPTRKAQPRPAREKGSGGQTDAGDDDERQVQAAKLIAELPATLTRGETRRLVALTVKALADGWPADQLRTLLLRDLGTARSHAAVWTTRLTDLGEPSAADTSTTATLPKCDACNPFRRLEDADGNDAGPCLTCNPPRPRKAA